MHYTFNEKMRRDPWCVKRFMRAEVKGSMKDNIQKGRHQRFK